MILILIAVAIPAMPVLAQGPDVYVYPSSGPVGTSVTVTGTDFTANANVQIYFPDRTAYQVGANTDNMGDFTGATFSIGSYPAGSYYVYVKDVSSGNWTQGTFYIIPTISIDQSSGNVGATIRVSGKGFGDSRGATIYFDDEQCGTTVTNSVGAFTNAAFIVPPSYQGSHTIKVQDTAGYSNTIAFTTRQSINLTPASGVTGSVVTVNGTGFKANYAIAITFDGAAVTTTPMSVATDGKGSFRAGFNVPIAAGGPHVVKSSDGTNEGVSNFTVSVSASITPTSGYVGDTVHLSGSGFQANRSVTINFDSQQVATTSATISGSFTSDFTVPARNAGKYKVTASDGVNTAETEFSITTTASISPVTDEVSPGYVGTEITISGVGFMAGKTVTVTYSDNQVATAIVSDNGSFSVTLEVPRSVAGEHAIVATDNVNTKQFTFFMESTPPPIPRPLIPEMGIRASTQPSFVWEAVTDPSGVTYTLQVATSNSSSDNDSFEGSIVLEKAGLTATEYTITKEERLKATGKKAPYYWHVKAVDSASNSSGWSGTGSFYVGWFSFSLGRQQLIYIGIGVIALLIGIFGFLLGRRTRYYY